VKGIKSVAAGFSGDFSSNSGEGSLITTLTPAESVKITYDPSQITYGRILQIYFSVIHDPTEKDRQGPDVGPQYRSNIFPSSDAQENIAESYIKQLGAAGVYPGPIVTRIDRFHRFVAAKPSEQDVMRNHADMAYVVAYDTPKLAELKRLFPADYVEQGLTYSD
jgi:peptide-methionine (S)-S-oxide reductase